MPHTVLSTWSAFFQTCSHNLPRVAQRVSDEVGFELRFFHALDHNTSSSVIILTTGNHWLVMLV